MPGAPDLFVVCKNCRNEVSPYITECPYCGTRLRKRAPKIERDGRVSDKGRRPRRRTTAPRLSKLRAGEIPGLRGERTGRPWATLTLVVLSLFGYLLLFAVHQGDVALVGDPGRQWWRFATTPFLYANAWYELAAVGAIGLYGWLLERRHGPWPVLALFVVCGMGGAALEWLIDPLPVALGGNGAALGMLCAWAIPDVVARSRDEDYEGDLLGTAVIGLVLLLMPLAVPDASAIAGFAGGAVGMVAGLLLARARIH
jgi:membrane associated rhomboid family serine protease